MLQTMHAYRYSHHGDSLDHMDFVTDFASGMVNFDVNFPELNDADVMIVLYTKPTVNVIATASTSFFAFLSEKDVPY